MYLYLHGGVRVKGYSSFYLADPSAFMPHLRWHEVPGGMLEHLHRYYERKWEANAEPPVVRLSSKPELVP
ncbi:hypothetical protein AB0B66_18900 [Catellatospora sp. NPDC049111]|uniref:hypothetical protein n=1 Tax=Catellatospora sp. NPDC049111 TaxID=3155271 RepID=UPI003400C19E